MGKIIANNRDAVTNVGISQTITIPDGVTFDGTDSSNDPLNARIGDVYYGTWPWSKGFVVKPVDDLTSSDSITVVMFDDYFHNEKHGVSTGTFVSKTFTGNIWNEDLIIKFKNDSGADITIEIGN